MHPLMRAALLGLVIATPALSYAQAPPNSAVRRAVFEKLSDSQWVRLASPALGRREGRLLERTEAELVLSPEPQPLRVPATSIDTLWTRGHSTKTGLIVGAILGAGLGALAGSELGEENAGSAQNVLGLAGIGALGGGLVGAFIGTAIPRWHRRYP